MDERSGEISRTLFGHSGPVYSVSFSPDRTLLLSCSEDATIRLWSLQIWTCLVVYKGHMLPVWDVKFSPLGYYFASCGNDRTARLWATDHYQPLRIFAGHFSDVDVSYYSYYRSGQETYFYVLFQPININLFQYYRKCNHNLKQGFHRRIILCYP